MTNLTPRGLDDERRKALEKAAAGRNQSLNTTALSLLRESLGLDRRRLHRTYDDLDDLAGTWTDAQAREFDRAIEAFDPLTHETAEFYSFILASLREKGRPIPTNDMWIAACALERGLVVYTRDSHFEVVPGLLVISG
jgi:predicted nucleic acid-binding protein